MEEVTIVALALALSNLTRVSLILDLKAIQLQPTTQQLTSRDQSTWNVGAMLINPLPTLLKTMPLQKALQ